MTIPANVDTASMGAHIERIMEMLPHGYPFLLVDRIIEWERNHYAVGLKNVTYNEPYFTGHFPRKPIMPGVLIIEAMAQTSALLVIYTLGKEAEGKLVYFMSVEEARFRKPVTPGDSVYIRVDKLKQRGNVWKFTAIASVDNKKVAEATFSAMIIDKEDS